MNDSPKCAGTTRGSAFPETISHAALIDITGIVNLVPYHVDKSLKLIWKIGYPQLYLTSVQTIFKWITVIWLRWGAGIVVLTVVTRRRVLFSTKWWKRKETFFWSTRNPWVFYAFIVNGDDYQIPLTLLRLILHVQRKTKVVMVPTLLSLAAPEVVILSTYGPLASYVKLRVVHALGMPGTFSPPPRVSDPDMHHGTCVMHVPWCMPGFHLKSVAGKTFPAFPAHAQPTFLHIW